MLDGHRIAELRSGRAAGCQKSLARRVRNQVQMKELFLVFHVLESGLLMGVDKVPHFPTPLSLSGKTVVLSTGFTRRDG
jgi:hypothetical protein